MTCPTCRGARERAGIGSGPAGCRPLVIPCGTCGATGEITEERARWIALGYRLRRYRLGIEVNGRRVYRSWITAADEHGVTLRQWIDAEAGRVDPAPLIARLEDAGRE